MTRLRADQLPKAVREKYGLDVKGSGSKRSRAAVGMGAPCAGRCSCGEEFETYTKFERHAIEAGHHRWEIHLPPRQGD